MAYRPIIPKNSQKSTFWGTSFCPILAILAPQKQSAARPNISAQVDTPGEFMALSNPYQYTRKPRFSKARFSKQNPAPFIFYYIHHLDLVNNVLVNARFSKQNFFKK